MSKGSSRYLLTHILTYALTRSRTCYALEAAHSLRSYVLRATHRDDDDVARVVDRHVPAVDLVRVRDRVRVRVRVRVRP